MQFTSFYIRLFYSIHFLKIAFFAVTTLAFLAQNVFIFGYAVLFIGHDQTTSWKSIQILTLVIPSHSQFHFLFCCSF